MTLCTNFASYLHQPGKRLFDVGFVLVPELGGGSRLEPLSDALTGAMPVATFLYVMLFLDRRRRCRCLTDWFRPAVSAKFSGTSSSLKIALHSPSSMRVFLLANLMLGKRASVDHLHWKSSSSVCSTLELISTRQH